MIQNTKTPWYPGTVKPARVGVYRVEKSYGETWAHWNGRTWSHGSGVKALTPRIAHALTQAHNPHAYTVLRWCGLANKPE